MLTFLSIIILELGERSENGSKTIEAVLANDPIIIEEEQLVYVLRAGDNEGTCAVEARVIEDDHGVLENGK